MENTVMLSPPVWREAFINDGSAASAESTYAMLSPEPYRMTTDRLEPKTFSGPMIPKSDLNCTQDIAMPPGPFA
jgi:hypothetical protein